MINVVKQIPKLEHHYKKCNDCNSILEFNNKDIQGGMSWSYIKCPTCKNVIELIDEVDY